MKLMYIDCSMGAAGDMLTAAVLRVRMYTCWSTAQKRTGTCTMTTIIRKTTMITLLTHIRMHIRIRIRIRTTVFPTRIHITGWLRSDTS